ncbi:MAG: geranylgeranylglyceryl/heptaprenylglyceryl phosphate synthase [Chitinophagaceae bacterium]|nr:geranylgeranylglyceryl/heptaprenylglyceryl phosphate synthase [Chitinophagaceae bacterium]
MTSRILHKKLTDLRQQRKKGFAVLVDPDKVSLQQISILAQKCNEAKVDFLFMGGSLMVSQHMDDCIKHFKSLSDIPVILFPGSPAQVSRYADALFYLSLISGRNPELLIGAHVVSAPMVKSSGLEVISTGYIVVDGGAPTTVSYMSHSMPVPHDKDDIAMCTAMAGEMQGKHILYMDAGSGAKRPISESMIQRVAANTEIPLIVGGGITDPEKAYLNCKAGADVIVVGNAIEKDINLIKEISEAVHQSSIKV